MNEEQKAWLLKQQETITKALTDNTVEAYEGAVDTLQQAIDTCPVP